MDDLQKNDLKYFFPAFIAWISLTLIATFWNILDPNYTLKPPMNAVGVTIFIVGLLIRVVALMNLKRNYSSFLRIRDDHQLITHGIYKYVRHPVYLGTFLSALAIPIYATSLPGTLIALTAIPLFNYRIANEEKMLIQEYGHQYTEYMKTTRKLLPYIY